MYISLTFNSIYAKLITINLEVIIMENIQLETMGLQPAFTENNVAILLCSNNKYAPYLSVVLQSILENSSAAYNYDIIIFTRDINTENQTLIQQQLQEYNNFSIRFYDVTTQMQGHTDLFVGYNGSLTLEIYYRILSPYILTNYDKLIYLDCDVIVNTDISKLYAIDLQTDNYLLAACRDPYVVHCYQVNYENIQKINGVNFPHDFDTNDYFNSGVLLLNLKAFRERYTLLEFFELARSGSWKYPDQDVLNYLTYKNRYMLSMQWNMIAEWKMRKKSKKTQTILDEYTLAYQDPYIIHYATSPDKKPWSDNKRPFADIWWKYAVNTPFNEQLQVNLIAIQKEQRKFKNKLKRLIEKMAKPIVNFFFPRNSKRGAKLRAMYFKKSNKN